MPWVYSHGSGTPPSYTWSQVNLYNQHCDNVSIPSNSAITQIKVNASGKDGAVSTRLVLWDAGGGVLKQTGTFTMSDGSESAGGQFWYTKTISSYKVTTGKTVWVGLYRNPSGSHIFGTTSTGGGTAYRKTNTSGFPNVYSMSGYSSQNKGAYVGAFYILAPSNQSSASVSRVSDTKQSVSWNNNPTSDRPYSSIKLQRWDNVNNSWYARATLSGSTSSYTDTTTIANRQYRYRVIAYNDAGNSSYVYSGYIDTTPSKPTSVSAVRSGSNVSVSWGNSATNEDQVRLQKRSSSDGGSTWGSWGSDQVLGANSTSYLDTSPYTYGQYRVRNEETGASLYSSYAESNDVVSLDTPNAPTNLTEDIDPLDATEQVVLSWQHNPTDDTAQTKFSLQYRIVGDSWPATPQYNEVSSSDSFMTISASTLTNGEYYEWQVKTWGSYSTGSSFSNIEELTTITRPTTAITDPSISTDYGFSELTVSWEYAQDEANYQDSYDISLYDVSDNLIESANNSSYIGDGESGSHIFITLLENTSTYTIKLTVTDDLGQTSIEESLTFDTDFLVPPVPTFELSSTFEDGSVQIAITNPTPTGVEIATSINNLWWSFDGGENYYKVLEDIPINTTVTHYTPNIGNNANTYYVEAVSSTPTTALSTTDEITLDFVGLYFLNSGPEFSTYLKLIGDIKLKESRSRENKGIQFEGRDYPVRYIGTHKTQILDFSCDLPVEYYETMVSLVESDSDIYYRDYRNRIFKCIIQGANFNKIDNGYAYTFSCQLVREVVE